MNCQSELHFWCIELWVQTKPKLNFKTVWRTMNFTLLLYVLHLSSSKFLERGKYPCLFWFPYLLQTLPECILWHLYICDGKLLNLSGLSAICIKFCNLKYSFQFTVDLFYDVIHIMWLFSTCQFWQILPMVYIITQLMQYICFLQDFSDIWSALCFKFTEVKYFIGMYSKL